MKDDDDRLVLERNPLEWSVSDVVDFIASTDCASLAKIFQEQVHIHIICKYMHTFSQFLDILKANIDLY